MTVSNGNKLLLKDKWKIYIKNKIQNEDIYIFFETQNEETHI